MGKHSYTHLCEVEVKMIKNMHKEGLTWAQMMRIIGRGRGAIASVINQKNTDGSKRVQVGRPQSITPKMYMMMEKALNNLQRKAHAGKMEEVTLEDVLAKTGISVCKKTARAAFRKKGITFKKLKTKPLLTRDDIKARYQWALRRKRRSKIAWTSRPHAIIDNKKSKCSVIGRVVTSQRDVRAEVHTRR